MHVQWSPSIITGDMKPAPYITKSAFLSFLKSSTFSSYAQQVSSLERVHCIIIMCFVLAIQPWISKDYEHEK